MAKPRIVEQLPPTSSIQDPEVRVYLDKLTNAWLLRNGDIGDGDQRFVTSAEFDGMARESIVGFFNGGPGTGGPGGLRPPTNINNILDGLAESVFASRLFRELGESIRRISAPWDVIDSLNTMVANALSGIAFVKNGITRIDSVTAGLVTTVTGINATVGTNSADIIQINTVSATSTSANARSLFLLTARVGIAEASIIDLNDITVDSSSATAQALHMVRATLGATNQWFFQTDPPSGGAYLYGDHWFETDNSEAHYYWDGDSWVLGSITPFQYSDAGILTEQTVRVTRDTALANAVNHIWATVGGVTANIEDGSFATAVAAQTAFAARWNTVQAIVYDPATNTNKITAVRQDLQTQINGVNGQMTAMYTLRVEVGVSGNTVVGGFGIVGAWNGTAGPTIDFGVRADRFFIASTTSAVTAVAPFIVQTTAGTWGAPGVYINTAVIGAAFISTAMIEDQIQSTNYVVNSAGWFINSDTGNAEFNNVLIRGTSTVGRLNVIGAIESSITVPNNSVSTVSHNENRKVIVNCWSPAGNVALVAMDNNSFSFRLDFSGGGIVYYRYF